MSRIGKKPVIIPANVTVTVAEGNNVTVKGPKGELTNTFNADMIINVEGNVLTVSRPTDEANHRALHGLTRTLIANMVEVPHMIFVWKRMTIWIWSWRWEKF